MNRLGIFGGSFDPPHKGHLQVARQAADELDLTAVLWIPARVSPHKTPETTSEASFRCDMIRLMIDRDPRFHLDLREISREGPSFTVDTLEALNLAHPAATLFLIIGEDSFLSLPTWKAPNRIKSLAQLVVYNRVTPISEARVDHGLQEGYWLDAPYIDITSSDIRESIANHERVDHLLTPEVAAYIETHGLYRS
ncbi:MAG: nicotinate (nicotinamide) nucleotide adenylyltransferase [Bacteroidetes bacterium]|nr:nicotinate (nicotinamide) nucleotide adenylyltransferase [Bacteroidota bacterium]